MINGLTENEYLLLVELLIAPLKNHGCQVWLFGSRATHQHFKYSDIDILYEESEQRVPSSVYSKIIEDLEESRLPYKVDVVNIKHLSSHYREMVLKQRVKL